MIMQNFICTTVVFEILALGNGCMQIIKNRVLTLSGNQEKVLKKKNGVSRSGIVLNSMLRSGKTARKS